MEEEKADVVFELYSRVVKDGVIGLLVCTFEDKPPIPVKTWEDVDSVSVLETLAIDEAKSIMEKFERYYTNKDYIPLSMAVNHVTRKQKQSEDRS